MYKLDNTNKRHYIQCCFYNEQKKARHKSGPKQDIKNLATER